MKTLGPRSHLRAPYRGVWSQSSEEPEELKERLVTLASCTDCCQNFGRIWICQIFGWESYLSCSTFVVQLILKGIVPDCELVLIPLKYVVNSEEEKFKYHTRKMWYCSWQPLRFDPPPSVWSLADPMQSCERSLPMSPGWSFELSFFLFPATQLLGHAKTFNSRANKTELPQIWQDFDGYSFNTGIIAFNIQYSILAFNTGILARSLAFVAPQWGAMCAPASM